MIEPLTEAELAAIRVHAHWPVTYKDVLVSEVDRLIGYAPKPRRSTPVPSRPSRRCNG